jgi:hypothetical protein
MARWRQAVELAITDGEIGRSAAIACSRSEAARRVERAQMLLVPTGQGADDYRLLLAVCRVGLAPTG